MGSRGDVTVDDLSFTPVLLGDSSPTKRGLGADFRVQFKHRVRGIVLPELGMFGTKG